MKRTKKHSYLRVVNSKEPIYPNAASARYHLGRLLDGALAGATVLGLVASVLFSLTLWG